MARIVFRYPAMQTAATNIADISGQYKQAAETFQTNLLAAISNWEGVSKDKFVQFITNPVNQYTHVTVPDVVTALSDMLEANATQMQRADHHIAQNIPTTLGG